MPNATASLSSNFTAIDWCVLVGYLVFVSVLGVKLAGKQKSMEDFFRGGNRLPWYAVSGSMIATIISAVTFVGVPAVAYAQTGNFTYLQFGIVAGLLSRLFVAFFLVPAYYRYQVYSPYDYMGQRLGESARSVTTALFSVLGVLAQAARVYLTAIILQLVLEQQLESVSEVTGISPLVLAISVVGIIAVMWTMLGGIATVVWTDAMLFLVFVVGGLVALGVVASQMPDGLAQVVREGWAAGKFKLWDLSVTPEAAEKFNSRWAAMLTKPYTIWAAIFAVTFGNIGSYGTDQLLAQRIFTCRNRRDAKWAVITSWTAELVVALMLLVGVGLWAFYKTFPEQLSGQAAAAVEAKADNIFPVFILTQVPVALRGLIVAGIFAAAISSLTSILAALSQTTLSAVYLPLRGLSADQPIPEEENQRVLTVSRILIVLWGVALCAMAVAIDGYVEAQKAQGNEILFLDLALGLANYIIGTLFAAFLLAWLPLGKDGYGLIWSAPLSVFCVVATRFHTPATYKLCVVVSVVLILISIIAAMWPSRRERRGALLLKTGWLVLGCALMLRICRHMWFAEIDPGTGTPLVDEQGLTVMRSVAWPWYAPIGGSIALVFGYLLGEPRKDPQRYEIATFSEDELERVVALWNNSSAYPRCDKAVIQEKVFEDPGVLPEMRLMATNEGQLVGFCVGAWRNDTRRGHIKLLAVDPAVRRQGIGSALLSAVEQALAARAIGAIRIDEAAPDYLTPGLDERNQEALAFFGAHGYEVLDKAQNMSVDLIGRDFGTDAEEESLGERKITIRRAASEDRSAVDRLLDAHWPAWKGEIERAFQNDPISLHIALRDNDVVGFSAYDANNVGTGWFGPMGTDPSATGQGIGRVLLRRCLADLQSQSRQRATIPWVGPVEFYERHCGAVTSERFLRLEKRL